MYYQLHGPYTPPIDAVTVPMGGIILHHESKQVRLNTGRQWQHINHYDYNEYLGPEWAYEYLSKAIIDGILNQNYMEIVQDRFTKGWQDTIKDPEEFFGANGYKLFVKPGKLRVKVDPRIYESLLSFGKY